MSHLRTFIRFTWYSALYIFAFIGVLTTAVYIAMNYGLLNVRGNIADRNTFFGDVPTTTPITIPGTPSSTTDIASNGCVTPSSNQPCDWDETVYWEVVAGGLEKDAAIIQRVAAETGVSARMIAAAVVPEQTRFFTDNRDVFKRYFEPLKLLGTLSKFSLGVSGIKLETALAIEAYANDTVSPFYPGSEIAPLLAYSSTTTDTEEALFNRLTDEKDHYYSYLYTATFLKEITSQWEKAGYDIHDRPDVLVTLFNLGFAASAPKADPKAGGAPVTTGGTTYNFGELGSLFYHSEALTNLFPSTP